MSTNQEVARIFAEIADLLDLAGERFKPDAYRRAARSIESLTEDIRNLATKNELRLIPGVGEAIEEKIRDYLATGKIAYYEKVQSQFPAGIVELMRLPGIGPKTARRFLVELGVEGPAELVQAIDAGRLTGVKGFGAKKIQLFRDAVEQVGSTGRRTPLREALDIADGIVRGLTETAPVDRIEMAGSLRRRRESVGDLDVLVTSRTPERVFDAFSALPGVRSVVLRGPTKETVLWEGGIQVDLRVVEPESFGAALQYFIGSKEHNIRLRSLARDRGLKINEYGVFRGDDRVAGGTEEDVYGTFGLPVFPPEIRENQGEFEAATAGKLPVLVEESDVVGDLHVHPPYPFRVADVEQMYRQAAAARLTYVGWTVPAKVASTTDGKRQLRSVRERAPGSITPLVGLAYRATELPSTLPAGVDFVVVRPEAGDAPPPEDVRAGGTVHPAFLAHLDPVGGTGAADSASAWMRWAKDRGVAVEVTPQPGSTGLDSLGIRRWVGDGGLVVLSSAASVERGFKDRRVAVGLARRGWATSASVLNGRPLAALRAALPAAFPAARVR